MFSKVIFKTCKTMIVKPYRLNAEFIFSNKSVLFLVKFGELLEFKKNENVRK